MKRLLYVPLLLLLACGQQQPAGTETAVAETATGGGQSTVKMILPRPMLFVLRLIHLFILRWLRHYKQLNMLMHYRMQDHSLCLRQSMKRLINFLRAR